MRKPIYANNLDLSMVTYKPPRDLPNGGSVVYMNFEDGPITLQTPNMFCPFGLKDWKGNENYTLDISFKGRETDPKMKAFYDKMVELDDKMLDDCVTNGTLWLKKKIDSKSVAGIIYTKQVKFARDKNGNIDERFPPTFKLKVPYKDGRFVPDVFDKTRELIDLNDVDTKGANITAIIQCTGIWTAGGKYGLGWKIMQMLITPPVSKKFAFLDLDEEDEPIPVANMNKFAKLAIKDKPAFKKKVDDDDEDSDEVEDSDEDSD